MPLIRPLYLMTKPGPAESARLARLCTMLGIQLTYSPDRWHCTWMPLGESSPALIEAVKQALSTFNAEPFSVAFDRIEGNTLKPRRGMAGPGAFQRTLARRLAAIGHPFPDYEFGLHLNLEYQNTSDRRVPIPAISWSVDEILLVESLNGQGRHIHHARWELEARQYALTLG